MKVLANGKTYALDDGVTLARFVRDRGLDPRYVLVERNGEPVERPLYEELTLRDGDRLELVRAVAGG